MKAHYGTLLFKVYHKVRGYQVAKVICDRFCLDPCRIGCLRESWVAQQVLHLIKAIAFAVILGVYAVYPQKPVL